MRQTALGSLLPVSALLAWEVSAATGHVSSESLSRPSALLLALVKALADGSIATATLQTLGAAFLGFCIAAVFGIALGVLIGSAHAVDDLLRLTVEALRTLPAAALIPVALLLLGFGYLMEALVVAFAATWPILLITSAAVRGIDKRLIDVGRVLGLSRGQQVRLVLVPAILVRLKDALRLAAALGLVVAVTVEIVANPQGLGYQMVEAQQSFRPDLVFAVLFWIGLLGLAFDALFKIDPRR